MIYAFGPFELDDARFELRRSGALVPTQRRVFDLLLFLVRRAGAVSTRADLLRHVWGGAIVTKDAVAHAVRGARNALGDLGEPPSYVETVRGRGYRFCAPVAVREAQVTPIRRRSSPPEPTTDPHRTVEAIVAHLRAAQALLATLTTTSDAHDVA